jgi:iron complex outermembrane receptor protein
MRRPEPLVLLTQILFSLVGAGPLAASPEAPTVTGRVTATDGTPLAEAVVEVLDLGRSARTDGDGRYVLAQLPSGTFVLSFRMIGYAPAVRRVTVGAVDLVVDMTLKPSAIELPAVQVTASANATSPLESPQPTTVLDGDAIRQAEAPNLGATLEGVAGVHSLGTGIGIGKPVIRGLTSNRVLVLDDGQRLETQQWGDEHGPQIEAAGAERIEIIRGPASVLYGSDALGGVINVIPPAVPDAIGRSSFAHATLSGGFATDNRQPDGSVALEAASGGLGVRFAGTGRNSGNVRTPDYELWNSGNRALNGTAELAYRGSFGRLTARYTYRDERIELTDEDPAATPFQRIGEHRARAELLLPLGAARLEANAGYERNRRREFEAAGAADVALGLVSTTYTGEIHVHHPPAGPFAGIVGVAGQHTAFDKFGEETLIPDTRASSLGAFAFEQADLGRWQLSLGARYDFRHLDVSDDAELGVAAQTRTWNSITGNLGILYHAAPPVALVLNVGRGFRAPSSFDLFSNGVHEGTLAFERGDPNLKTEKSLNADLALRIVSASAVVELGGFANVIQDYIFTVPTTEVDSASGFQIFDVAQGNALLAGLEASIDLHATPYLHLHGTADYVRGQNTTTHEPLPSMPPLRISYGARLEGDLGRRLRNAYFSVGAETNARQSRLDPAEAEFFADAFDGAGYRPTGYTLLHLGAGCALPAGTGRMMRLDLMLRNALNTAYADFLSRIKTNASNPGQGRNLVGRVTVEF